MFGGGTRFFMGSRKFFGSRLFEMNPAQLGAFCAASSVSKSVLLHSQIFAKLRPSALFSMKTLFVHDPDASALAKRDQQEVLAKDELNEESWMELIKRTTPLSWTKLLQKIVTINSNQHCLRALMDRLGN